MKTKVLLYEEHDWLRVLASSVLIGTSLFAAVSVFAAEEPTVSVVVKNGSNATTTSAPIGTHIRAEASATSSTATTTPPAGPNSISGVVYNDQNKNTVRDVGEPGLAGWIITLHKANQKKNGKWVHNDKQVVGTTTTNASGFYLFGNLPSGTYIVDQIKVKGWKQTKDDTKVVLGVATSSISVDFSNVVKKANGRDKDKNKDDDEKDNGHRWGWFK